MTFQPAGHFSAKKDLFKSDFSRQLKFRQRISNYISLFSYFEISPYTLERVNLLSHWHIWWWRIIRDKFIETETTVKDFKKVVVTVSCINRVFIYEND